MRSQNATNKGKRFSRIRIDGCNYFRWLEDPRRGPFRLEFNGTPSQHVQKKVNCSTCGADVTFKSRSSIFGVCPYCKSMLVRSEVSIESIGTMSELPRDMSPLQIGTRGTFEGVKFEVVGRHRIAWESGGWNEWYCYFENGTSSWLADAQGSFMMSVEKEMDPTIQPSKLAVSDEVKMANDVYVVEDLREVRGVAGEGELPFRAEPGNVYLSVDLKAPNDKFASLTSSKEGNFLYLGHYVDFDELKLENLRKLDGW